MTTQKLMEMVSTYANTDIVFRNPEGAYLNLEEVRVVFDPGMEGYEPVVEIVVEKQ